MGSVFPEITGQIKDYIGWDKHRIDGFIFRLHSKTTYIILLTFAIIITLGQIVGDPIDCVVEDIPSRYTFILLKADSYYKSSRNILT